MIIKKARTPTELSLLDLTKETPEQTAKAILQFETGKARFNYKPLLKGVPSALRGVVSPNSISLQLQNPTLSIGEKANLEIIEILCKFAQGKPMDSHRIQQGHTQKIFLNFYDIEISVHCHCYYVENGRPVLVFVQPRKNLVIGRREIEVIFALIQKAFIDEDWADVGATIEILEVSCLPNKKKRSLRTYRLKDAGFNYASPETIGQILTMYAEGFFLAESEYSQRAPEEKPVIISPAPLLKDID